MITNKQKNYCPAPFRQVCINPIGELSPCCMINTEGFGKITDELNQSVNSIQQTSKWQEFLNQHKQEQMPEICEKSCGRHFPSEYHHQWAWSKSESWEDKTADIKRADIAFSNLCNLTCTMCSSTFSSEWIKIKKKMGLTVNDTPWNFSIDQVIELANKLSTCDIINIKGGEPFFNPRFKIFLKELADKNTNIHLPILTNGTIIDDEALTQLSRFTRTPTFCVSLESTNDKLYQLIRGGKYTFTDIKNNIAYVKNKFPKLIIKANYVLGSWNISNFTQDMNNLRNAGVVDCNILIVHHPYEQGIKVVGPKAREKWILEFEQELLNYPSFYYTMTKGGIDEQLILNLRTLPFTPPDIKECVKECNTYIDIRRDNQGIDLKLYSILGVVPNYIGNME